MTPVTEPPTGLWPPGTEDSIGQVGEFLVWASLITQSGGALHVFLPVLDRGLDAVVHRLRDSAYIGLQVKTKTFVQASEATIAVLESHLYTDDQLLIGVRLDGAGLGPYALVVDASTLRSKAGRIVDGTRELLVADMPIEPIPGHKWSSDLVSIQQLADRVGGEPVPGLGPPERRVPESASVIGTVGELEVARRVATLEDCGLFRPFPDLETAELLVRRLATGSTLGLQIKTAELDEPHSYRHILIHRSSFVAAPTTFVVAVAWIVPERRFHPTCLVVPSAVVPSIAGMSGEYFELHFRPDGSREASRLDPYRLPLDGLAAAISQRLG